MEVYDLTRPPELYEAAVLMDKHADTPMDFADATLVLLGEALGVGAVLTLDRRGFSTYRTRTGRAFLSVLDLTDLSRSRSGRAAMGARAAYSIPYSWIL
jgi:hypothetical protein